jgi:signal transduction histidine kinase
MLLNDILILEKQSLGKYQIKLKPLNIVSFLHNIYSEFYANKYESRVFDLPTEDTNVMINTDYQLLTHVLTNLIDNALKYSPLHTPIMLSIKVLPKTVEISVADQGIGVPENEQSKLFESFFRASNVNYISGTGLGLSIVKQFVTILNGSIHFESQLGKGTRFCVTLPRCID